MTMAFPSATNHPYDEHLDEALELVNDLARRVVGGEFIFRGEARSDNPYIATSLYRYIKRQYPDVHFDGVDISHVQEEMLGTARGFTTETDEHEILATLRHNGGVVNVVDFTTDYNVALFFACDGSTENNRHDGRIIVLDKNAFQTFVPNVPANRVLGQRSIFVVPNDGSGTIPPSEASSIVTVPAHLKPTILRYLSDSHDIRLETIYNDLLGFISLQDRFTSPFAEITAGSMAAMHGDLVLAADRFSTLIDHPLWGVLARYERGQAYRKIGKFAEAVADFSIVIDSGSALPGERLALAHYERGAAFLQLNDLPRSSEDLERAKTLIAADFVRIVDVSLGFLLLAQSNWDDAKGLLQSALDRGFLQGFGFSNEFGSVPEFNQKYGVVIPDDLAEVLAPPPCDSASE